MYLGGKFGNGFVRCYEELYEFRTFKQNYRIYNSIAWHVNSISIGHFRVGRYLIHIDPRAFAMWTRALRWHWNGSEVPLKKHH